MKMTINNCRKINTILIYINCLKCQEITLMALASLCWHRQIIFLDFSVFLICFEFLMRMYKYSEINIRFVAFVPQNPNFLPWIFKFGNYLYILVYFAKYLSREPLFLPEIIHVWQLGCDIKQFQIRGPVS